VNGERFACRGTTGKPFAGWTEIVPWALHSNNRSVQHLDLDLTNTAIWAVGSENGDWRFGYPVVERQGYFPWDRWIQAKNSPNLRFFACAKLDTERISH